MIMRIWTNYLDDLQSILNTTDGNENWVFHKMWFRILSRNRTRYRKPALMSLPNTSLQRLYFGGYEFCSRKFVLGSSRVNRRSFLLECYSLLMEIMKALNASLYAKSPLLSCLRCFSPDIGGGNGILRCDPKNYRIRTKGSKWDHILFANLSRRLDRFPFSKRINLFAVSLIPSDLHLPIEAGVRIKY